MSMPICTVLLITYNHAPYLRKCINSVLSQKTKYKYIIKIFDDASTDGSSDIVREYANKYPNLIEAHIANKNMGAQANIWRAYQSVDTKYCIFTETDDYWCDESKLQMQIEALEKHPECSFCSHQSYIKNINDSYRENEDCSFLVKNKKVLNSSLISMDDILKEKPLGGYMTSQASRLLRMKDIHINEIKFKEAFLFDNCQYYYMLLKGKMFFINKTMTVYQQTGTGTCSGIHPYKRIEQQILAFIEFNKEVNYRIADRVFQDLCLYINYSLGLVQKKEKRVKGFIKLYKKIYRYILPPFLRDIIKIPNYLIKLFKYCWRRFF